MTRGTRSTAGDVCERWISCDCTRQHRLAGHQAPQQNQYLGSNFDSRLVALFLVDGVMTKKEYCTSERQEMTQEGFVAGESGRCTWQALVSEVLGRSERTLPGPLVARSEAAVETQIDGAVARDCTHLACYEPKKHLDRSGTVLHAIEFCQLQSAGRRRDSPSLFITSSREVREELYREAKSRTNKGACYSMVKRGLFLNSALKTVQHQSDILYSSGA